jgi:hypothetical protein
MRDGIVQYRFETERIMKAVRNIKIEKKDEACKMYPEIREKG